MRVTIAFAVTALTVFVVSAGAYVTPASAATGHVINCDSSGPGSLPDTVTAAGSGDTIVFDLDCTGLSAIVLSGAISVSGTTLTIDGSGHTVTISGNDATRILTVQASATLTLVHLMLTHGRSTFGGAIRNGGALHIQNSTLSLNSTGFDNFGSDTSGAIYNTGSAIVEGSTFDRNSAAIAGAIENTNVGTLTIRTSSFVDNKAGNDVEWGGGGAIINEGVLNVDRSTFTGNSAFNSVGGAISDYGTLVLRNTTVSGNDAVHAGAIYADSDTATVEGDTISDNAGSSAISFSPTIGGSFTIKSTIVSGTESGTNCVGDALTDGGYNLDDDGSCSFSDHSVSGDPHLGPLGFNGGPTQTRALGEGSPALSAGSATVCQSAGIGNVDQRGNPRRAGTRGNCDIGAYDTGTGPPAAAKTTIGRNPTRIVADGLSTSTITVTAKDASGNRLRLGGATVTLATTLGSLSAVTDKHDGTYTAILTSGTVRGTAKLTGTINGNSMAATAGVDFVAGPPSGSTSTIARSARSIPADGSSTATITVQAKDQYGNVIKTGGANVTLQATAGSLSGVTDLGNGKYTAILTSATSPALSTISGTIAGQPITATTTVRFT